MQQNVNYLDETIETLLYTYIHTLPEVAASQKCEIEIIFHELRYRKGKLKHQKESRTILEQSFFM